jgi:hypothetical protein
MKRNKKFLGILVCGFFSFYIINTANGQLLIESICLNDIDSKAFLLEVERNPEFFSVKCSPEKELQLPIDLQNMNEKNTVSTCLALKENFQNESVIYIYDMLITRTIKNVDVDERPRIEVKKKVCYMNSINLRDELFEIKKGIPS